MIAGIFHQGSGLGNQLHRYVATRVKALDLGVDFGMTYYDDGSGKEKNFKGQSFMDIDWGDKSLDDLILNFWHEKKVVENGVDIRGYDPEFNFIEDNTIIDGEFQDERYWEHHADKVKNWLKTEPLDVPDDVCVIGFRGGEFAVFADLFLPYSYWSDAIDKMLAINPKMKFEVHTDDEVMAQRFFPGIKVIHDIGINWRSIRYAKYAIIANSSFYILPRWLRHTDNFENEFWYKEHPTYACPKSQSDAITIAPRYWARRNTKVWALPQNYYDRFNYI